MPLWPNHQFHVLPGNSFATLVKIYTSVFSSYNKARYGGKGEQRLAFALCRPNTKEVLHIHHKKSIDRKSTVRADPGARVQKVYIVLVLSHSHTGASAVSFMAIRTHIREIQPRRGLLAERGRELGLNGC